MPCIQCAEIINFTQRVTQEIRERETERERERERGGWGGGGWGGERLKSRRKVQSEGSLATAGCRRQFHTEVQSYIVRSIVLFNCRSAYV